VAVLVGVALACLGDALGPMTAGEAGFDLAIFDLGAEFSVLALPHGTGLALLFTGVAVAARWRRHHRPAPFATRLPQGACPAGLAKVPI
jgi:hypothetical protein